MIERRLIDETRVICTLPWLKYYLIFINIFDSELILKILNHHTDDNNNSGIKDPGPKVYKMCFQLSVAGVVSTNI